jgi:hypothetical protein
MRLNVEYEIDEHDQVVYGKLSGAGVSQDGNWRWRWQAGCFHHIPLGGFTTCYAVCSVYTILTLNLRNAAVSS